MRIVFMGTPEFAVPSLERLAENGYLPVAVVTGPDKPRGRGQKVSVTPVKARAIELGVETILQPESVKDAAFREELAALEPDVLVVVAFRILPPDVIDLARRGAFNLHGSLLPRYRGAAPINRAIMAGETVTGVTTFFLATKVDTGNVILQREMPIGPDETAGELHDRMMLLGADAVLDTVRLIEQGDVKTSAQDDRLATAAPKIFREDCRIPWAERAGPVHDFIRGLSPHPAAWTTHGETLLKVYRSRVVAAAGTPGEVVEAGDRLVVACGEGAVELVEVQREGGRRTGADSFLRGYPLRVGDRLDGSQAQGRP